MKKLFVLLAALLVISMAPAMKAQAQTANQCVSVSYTPPSWGSKGDTIFTNTCNQNITLVVSGVKGNVWFPSLIGPGANNSHDNGNGPFHYFACVSPKQPYDSVSTNNYPNYSSVGYICQ